MTSITEIEVPDTSEKVYEGKVQVHLRSKGYNKAQRLAIFTDRISAGDERLGFPIKNKGRILVWSTVFFKQLLEDIVPNDIISCDQDYSLACGGINKDRKKYWNRALLIREVTQIPVECIARSYLVGSLHEAYQNDQPFPLGYHLPEGMKKFDKLKTPIFTPSIKNKEGHDTNITYRQLVEFLREWLAREENRHFKIDARILAQLLRSTTLAIFRAGSDYLYDNDLVLADWKGEFGFYLCDGEVILVWSDEGITPDTARIWRKESCGKGMIPVGLDKDAVRNWISEHDGNRDVPYDVRAKTAEAYKTFAHLVLPKEYLCKIYEEP